MALEAIFDIGHHVLAGRNLPIPATYREILPALTTAGVIPTELEQRLRGVAGFRNLLVHDYAELDVQRVWELIDTRLPDLQEVERCLAEIAELRHG